VARRRGLIQAPRGARRLSSWGFGTGGVTVTSVSSTSNTIIGSGVALSTEDKATIVRTHGRLVLSITAAAAAEDACIGAFGVCLVSAQAFAAGAASIPDPQDDRHWDGWLLHQSYALMHRTATEDDVSDLLNTMSVNLDSKGMRIWGGNDTMVAILGNTEVGTGPSLQVMWDSRVLLKLG